jgi:hypothetical protein
MQKIQCPKTICDYSINPTLIILSSKQELLDGIESRSTELSALQRKQFFCMVRIAPEEQKIETPESQLRPAANKNKITTAPPLRRSSHTSHNDF